jgi:beta-lactamase regulating signal transducer with metallopeptidase domain
MAAFDSVARAWGPLALTITWQLAVLAVLVWLCEWALRLRQARVRHTLWWCVLVAPLLLAPARLALDRRDALVAVPTPQPVGRVVALTGSLDLLPALRQAPPQPAATPMPESTPAAAPQPPPSPSFELSWPALLLTAWLLGCAIVAARMALGHRSLFRMIAASRPVTDEGALADLESLRREAGVSREVALRATGEVGAPLLYGIRRPAILMPERWLDSLSPEDLRVVLAHEAAHVKRGDLLGNLLQRLAELPLFFHPAAWLAGRRIMLAREELCDAAALRPGVDPKSYALSLLAAAEKTRTTHAVASVGVAEGKFTLLRRVEAIMETANVKGLGWAAAIGLTLVLLAATAALTSAQVRAEPATVALNAAEGSAGGVDSTGDGVPGMPQPTAAQGGEPRTAALEGATPSGGGGGGGRHGLPDEDLKYPAEAVHVRSNMQRLGLAMRGYLTVHDGVFPGGRSAGDLLTTLGPYLAPERLLIHATVGDPLDVRYLLPSGAAVPPAEAAETPFAEAEHGVARGVRVVAYADGHVEFRREDDSSPGGGGGWGLAAVFSNMEQLALAMRAYLADHDGKAPPAGDIRTALKELEPYLEPRLLFLRPGTRDEVVQYVIEPGTNWSDLSGRGVQRTPVFVADYDPEFTVIVSASMGAGIELKKGGPAQ